MRITSAERAGRAGARSKTQRRTIRDIAAKANLDLTEVEIIDTPHSHAAAAEAVQLVRAGHAELLMKGSLHTDELLGAVVARAL
jgi:phosphate acetyltransferase